MRHADSIERADPQTRDHERSITDMGRKAAAQVNEQCFSIALHCTNMSDDAWL